MTDEEPDAMDSVDVRTVDINTKKVSHHRRVFGTERRVSMLYQIKDGTVTLGGCLILSHVFFEVRGNEKIAVVGRNGAGKTTLLRLIAGELSLDRDDKREGTGILYARKVTVGMLSQQTFANASCKVGDFLMGECPFKDSFDRDRFEYEKEIDRLLTGLGLTKEDKGKTIGECSGGEQAKIALIRLLLEKPDLLLLDEPTNHLDLEACQWLENYLKTYPYAVVMVSHDRFFLDRVVDVVYELSDRKLTRYAGTYTRYRQEKRKRFQIQRKAYEHQQEEIARLSGMVERFKNKPAKASFARAKRKKIEQMKRVEKPEEDEAHMFTGEIEPLVPGSKWVFTSEHLKIGYDKVLLELTLRIRRGQKIAVLGPNGAGKTAFLKTVAGLIPPLKGEFSMGNRTAIGYFDQMSAGIESEQSVFEHFSSLFPGLSQREARSILGAYLFGGREGEKKVKALSGGEKSRLILCELLQSRPNFMILDEPTNHMDIQAKETMESAFQAYRGTILFVSHDRYFIRQVADAVLIFENQSVMYYPFGYEHYLERKERQGSGSTPAAQIKAEEQALIQQLRAVPKGERHCLREYSTEASYRDWRIRLAGEHLEEIKSKVGELAEKAEGLITSHQQEESFWMGEVWREEGDYRETLKAYEKAWEAWNQGCLEWLDAVEEAGGIEAVCH